jgi:hypothetical protein
MSISYSFTNKQTTLKVFFFLNSKELLQNKEMI